jgi:hypothetical protein
MLPNFLKNTTEMMQDVWRLHQKLSGKLLMNSPDRVLYL